MDLAPVEIEFKLNFSASCCRRSSSDTIGTVFQQPGTNLLKGFVFGKALGSSVALAIDWSCLELKEVEAITE